MLRRSNIGWCDYSGGDLNFVIGCTKITEGCANCYGFRWAERVGRDFTQVTTYWNKLERLREQQWRPSNQPYRRGSGSKPIMFPVDLGDLFHISVPSKMILAALDIFADRDDADWALLTKRSQRMSNLVNHWVNSNKTAILPPNIWCIASVENQRRAEERIPWLLQTKATIRGLCMEPMLRPIDLTGPWHVPGHNVHATTEYLQDLLHWIIVGAESGPNRRHFEVEWALNSHRQSQYGGIPFFGKQDSGLYPGVPLLLNGAEVKEWPEVPIPF